MSSHMSHHQCQTTTAQPVCDISRKTMWNNSATVSFVLHCSATWIDTWDLTGFNVSYIRIPRRQLFTSHATQKTKPNKHVTSPAVHTVYIRYSSHILLIQPRQCHRHLIQKTIAWQFLPAMNICHETFNQHSHGSMQIFTCSLHSLLP